MHTLKSSMLLLFGASLKSSASVVWWVGQNDAGVGSDD